MKDELDPEVFGDLPPLEEVPEGPGEAAEAEAYQPQYPLIQSLGTGAKGVTHLCYDPYRQGEQVVQKLITDEASHQYPDIVDHDFFRLQGLAHPCLALVRDFGWEGSQAFLVREWIQGTSLSQALPKLRQEEILGVFLQLLQVLDYLYSQNTLHLHLNPENLIVVSENSEGPLLKVTDFGLGEALDRHPPDQDILVGTPPFTAPEYASDPSPDPKADLYSVGALFYWALSKQLPYVGKDPGEILKAQKKGQAKPLHEITQVDPKLSNWVHHLLQPDPQDRPRDPRTALQEYSNATDGMKLRSPSFPPLIFSDPEQIFRHKYFVKTFRRIALQGRFWAFQGKPGMGKTFFARLVQRYFWINQKKVRFYDGGDLFQCVGEILRKPTDPLFIVIDNADHGPVSPWLENRPYQNVIIFGEDLGTIQGDPRWQFFFLNELEPEQIKKVYKDSFGPLSDESSQLLTKQNHGNPGALVQQARGLARQGVLKENRGKWVLQEDKLQRVMSGTEGGVDQVISTLDSKIRHPFSLLSLVQVPLSVDTLGEWLNRDAKSLHPFLVELVRQELAIRRTWWGQEFFQSILSPQKGLPEGIKEEEIQEWAFGLEELGWYRQGKELLQRALPPKKLQQNSELVLTLCRLAGLADDHDVVFQNITASFVKNLPADQQALAYEILGRSLMLTEKGSQAEAAYKKAFSQYRTTKDIAGQVQVLTDLALWYGKTGDSSRGAKFFEQTLSLADKLPEESPLLGQVHLDRGRFYDQTMNDERAEEYYLKSIDHFTKYGQYHLLGQAYQFFASFWVRNGEFQQAEYYAREALSIAVFKEDFRTQGGAFLTLAQVLEGKGIQGGILERLSEAVFVLKKQGVKSLYLEAMVRRAIWYEKNRQLDHARKEAEKVLDLSEKTDNFLWQAQGHMILGKILRRDMKKLDQAYDEFKLAQDTFEKAKNIQYGWECAFEMGEIERNRGNPQAARPLYESALNQLNRYVRDLPAAARKRYLKDGKQEQIEMALKWLK